MLRYLKGTSNHCLFYPVANDLIMQGYCDVDWGTYRMRSRSLTGYCAMLGSSLVSWKTEKKKTVAKCSAEAKYTSMSTTASELVWSASLLKDLQVPVSLPITLYCDNKAAKHIAENPVFHERTKHLNIDCHYVRDKIQEGFLMTKHVPSAEQLADLMTNPWVRPDIII